jgi:hypothetical protein
MTKYYVHTRSFHPGKTFGSSGLGFSGDNRGFATGFGVTSRIKHMFEIDLASARVVNKKPVSDPSHHEGMGITQNYTDPRKQPKSEKGEDSIVMPYRKESNQSFRATISYHGKNFAFPGTDWEQEIPYTGLSISTRHGAKRFVPDLDVTNTVFGHVDRAGKKLYVTCELKGDGFPNCETFMVDQSGTPLFLCSHIRVGVATAQLFGDRRIPMGRAQLEVDLNSDDSFASKVRVNQSLDYAGDGSPIDLTSRLSSNPASISAWNQVHTGRDALGPESRRNMDNSIWEGVKQRLGQ